MRFLHRWFVDVPIARKLYFTVGTMAALIGVELFVLLFSLNTLSSLRAYVGGEGLWSKAQKDAVFHLYRYGTSRNNRDYELFEQFMRVPIGDARTWQELQKPDPNMNAAREGFLQGRNHPDDVDGMISLFSHFSNVYYIKKAITVWGEGQVVAVQLLPIAESLRQEINSPNPSQARINQLEDTVYAIDQRLTAFEDEFSFTLGEGSRWLERVVLKLLFSTALTVEATGLLLTISVSRGIHKGLTNIISAANAFSAGELSARAKILSRDEIGVVASAFNEMAGNLQTRVREFGRLNELARLNQDLRHEVAERERAEAELRLMNETLEARVAERTSTMTHTVDALHKEAADRERVEAVLRQTQKMDAVGQLTGGIAHYFNNMLVGISGSLEMISRRTAQGSTVGLERYIDAALTSAARAATLNHRLLAFSRRQTLDPKPTDLNRLVLGMMELFKNTIGPAIRLETKLDPTLGLTLCDPNQLESSLLNLVINACDATPEGGSLRIETTNSVIPEGAAAFGPSMLPPDDYVTLTVTDTGIGMTPAVLPRAFDPFFTTKPLGQGTGLGLSMVYGFVQQSGGEVLLRSMEGQGTTATIHLPRYLRAVDPISQQQTAAAATPRLAPSDAVVLVVEDERDVRLVVVDLLEDIGYTVLSANDGASGLEIVDSERRIDLLVSDVGLPGGMNGRQLADAARQRRLGLKVLFITGYSEASAMGSGLLDEGTELMTKPFSLTAFASKVQGIISA
ncbi:MAG TPA: ATP-binding protein [Rhodopila sp.]